MYHIPKYQEELPAEKSPDLKLCPDETKVSEPMMGFDGDIVSAAVANCKTKNWSREVKMKGRPFISVLSVQNGLFGP